jgi:hypothetical protein
MNNPNNNPAQPANNPVQANNPIQPPANNAVQPPVNNAVQPNPLQANFPGGPNNRLAGFNPSDSTVVMDSQLNVPKLSILDPLSVVPANGQFNINNPHNRSFGRNASSFLERQVAPNPHANFNQGYALFPSTLESNQTQYLTSARLYHHYNVKGGGI